MIQGNFYTGSAIRITLETGFILTGGTVGVLVQSQSGTVIDKEAEIVDLSSVRIILGEDETLEVGQYTLQAYVVLDGLTFKGAPENIVVLPGISA